mmetsp:Transcript_5710/g.16336  ORF Transcript_5710/g.16336 Transcript_5710/m.16336 type:complete len:117 (+) Transcript_5710:87-437(+)
MCAAGEVSPILYTIASFRDAVQLVSPSSTGRGEREISLTLPESFCSVLYCTASFRFVSFCFALFYFTPWLSLTKLRGKPTGSLIATRIGVWVQFDCRLIESFVRHSSGLYSQFVFR